MYITVTTESEKLCFEPSLAYGGTAMTREWICYGARGAIVAPTLHTHYLQNACCRLCFVLLTSLEVN